jgi:hypothetical protein
MLLTWMQALPICRHRRTRPYLDLGSLVEIGSSFSVRQDGGSLNFRRMLTLLWDDGTFSPLPLVAVPVPAPRGLTRR